MPEHTPHTGWKKWRRKPYVWVLLLMLALAFSADFIANALPLYAVKDGHPRYPVLEKMAADWGLLADKTDLNRPQQWLEPGIQAAVWTPIRYSPTQTDRYNDRFRKPHLLRDETPQNFPHHLGTDELGHDVASVLIHGTAISFFIGVFSMLLAAAIGIVLGAVAGFWGDTRLRGSAVQIVWMLLGLALAWFYGVQIHQNRFTEALNQGGVSFLGASLLSLLCITGILLLFGFTASRPPFSHKQKQWPVPVDFVLSRLIEFMVVLPKILLILAVAATIKPSILLPALVIGFTSWPAIARFTRAEMLHVRHSDYLRAAETFGLSEFRLLFRHALPNSLGPVPSLVAFGIAGAVLAESTLSFLGIGIPPEVFTWGKLLAQGRSNPAAWWVTLLPGLLIFLTVTCFHLLGEDLQGKTRSGKRFLRYFW